MANIKPEIYTGLFNDSFTPVRDGVAVAVENYAHWLPENGMYPLVVTPWNRPRPEVDYPLYRYLSIPIIGRRPYRFGLQYLDPLIWHKLSKTRFNLVHAHSPFSSGRLAQYVAHKQNVPLIATFHSKFRADMERSFHGNTKIVDRIIKSVISFFDGCDEVWIPQAEVEETIRDYGFKGEVAVVPNGSDLMGYNGGDLPGYKRHARIIYDIPQDKFSLLFVGQHIFEKGLKLIVQTLICLKQRQMPIVMNFIGTGYAQNWLKQQIVEHGLGDIVNVLGPIQQRSRMADYYAASDLLFFPSPYDNAPLVVREAAAMGTPSLLLKGSTAASIVRDGTDAFLCSTDADECADLIASLAEDMQQVRKVGENASRTLCRSWQDIIAEVVDRYRAAIQRK